MKIACAADWLHIPSTAMSPLPSAGKSVDGIPGDGEERSRRRGWALLRGQSGPPLSHDRGGPGTDEQSENGKK